MGMNMRMPELTAAMALRALPELGTRLDRREAIQRRYRDAWNHLPLTIPGPAGGERSAHKDALVYTEGADARKPLRAHLAASGIATRTYYDPAIPDLTAFSGVVASADRSRRLARRSLALPIHGRLSDGQVDRVIAAMQSFSDWP
jgi:dTDP-4-amino-4,6-dideoxygalactose transaminase